MANVKNKKAVINMAEQLANGQPIYVGTQDVVYTSLTAPVTQEACDTPEATESTAMNLNNIGNSSLQVIQFFLNNTTANLVDVVIGSAAAEPDIAKEMKLTDISASDTVGALDQFGAQVRKVQMFSQWASQHGFLINHVRIFGATGTQVEQQIVPFRISPNGDSDTIQGTITKRNSDLNWVELLGICPFPINTARGFIYPVEATTQVKMEIGYIMNGMVEQMTAAPIY